MAPDYLGVPPNKLAALPNKCGFSTKNVKIRVHGGVLTPRINRDFVEIIYLLCVILSKLFAILSKLFEFVEIICHFVEIICHVVVVEINEPSKIDS